MATGRLFIVATPIGNLADMTQRASETLKSVSLIAAEDTRHSRKLLTAWGIQARLLSLHAHNERAVTAKLLKRLQAGEHIALVSDAGTPTISDPGLHLVRAAQDAGVSVTPIPGASAVTAALSAAGLPANRFYFRGFLPDRREARRAQLEKLAAIEETLVFYESGQRITACLADVAEVLGGDREAVICRELSKLHETIIRDCVSVLLQKMRTEQLQRRGEFVLLVAGATPTPGADVDMRLVKRLLIALGDSLPTGQAASVIARALSCPRKIVYQLALEIKRKQ